jgi:hypothetical protein
MLGNSSLRIRDYGCALVCITDYWRWRGHNVNPRTMNNWGKANGAFSGSLVNWQRFLGPLGRTTTRVYWENVSANLPLIRAEINAGRPVFVQTCIGQNPTSRHWVTVVSYNSNDLLIADPLFGDIVWHRARYGDPARWIYGAVLIR